MVNGTSALLAQAETAESTSASGGGPDAVPITLQVNGVARALQVEPRATLGRSITRAARPDGDQNRLRSRRLWRVHGVG